MESVTLKNGFSCEIAPDVLDDFELLELLCKLDGGDISVIPAILRALLGDQVEALKNHLRGENGRVKTSDITAALGEIFEQVKTLKNS